MAYIPSFNEAVIAAANVYLATGGLTPTFSDVTITGGTTTTNNPVLDMTQTWNNGATTFTGLKFNVTDTASAPGSLLLNLQVDEASKFSVTPTGEVISASDFWVRSNAANAGVYWGSSGDVFLTRDAANTLALRNGTAAQGLNVYNTYTDASNYERGLLGWGSNLFVLGTEKAGTGIPRALQFRIDGNNVWQFNTAGHLVANSDNTFDIGLPTANRPRTGYFGTSVSVGAGYGWLNSKGAITQAVDGQYTFSNFAGTQSVTATVGASHVLTLNGGLITGASIITPGDANYQFNGRSVLSSPVDGAVRLANNSGTLTTDITLTGASGSGGSTANFGGNVGSGGSFTAAATGYYGFSTRNLILSPADGTTRLSNWGGTLTTDITLSGASGSGGSLATFGGGVTATLDLYAGATRNIAWSGRSVMKSSANGNIGLYDSAEISFNLLQFGGTTSSFPAIKRNAANIEFRLADDSARTGLLVGSIDSAGTVTAGGAVVATTYSKTTATTVAGLVSAATAGAGARSFVTDANATMAAGIGTVVVGGGSNKVPVYSDGTDWLIG